MASAYKRTWRGEDGKERVRWVAAYRDQDGRRHNKGFVTRKDAKTFLTLVEGEIVRGIHTPEHASITAAKAADLWLTRIGTARKKHASPISQSRPPAHRAADRQREAGQAVDLGRPAIFATSCSRPARGRPRARYWPASSRSSARRCGAGLSPRTAPPRSRSTARGAKRASSRSALTSRPWPTSISYSITRRGWRPFFVTAVFTGMRASELRGLVWDAVDFDKKTIAVRQRADIWGTMGRPKSAAGERVIPMAPLVVNVLKEWRLACLKGELGRSSPMATATSRATPTSARAALNHYRKRVPVP